MLQPNNHESRDLTKVFEEESVRQLDERNLEVSGIEIPLKDEPVIASDPPPDLIIESDDLLPVKPKKGKAWLLLPVLALGGGAAFILSQPQPPGESSPVTSSSKVAKPEPVNLKASKNPISKPFLRPKIDRAKLKALWQKGAAAKQRGDYAAARAAWQEGLKIEPNNTGFKESIAKLNQATASANDAEGD